MAGGFRISTQKKHIRQKRRVKASLDLVIVEKKHECRKWPIFGAKRDQIDQTKVYVYI